MTCLELNILKNGDNILKKLIVLTIAAFVASAAQAQTQITEKDIKQITDKIDQVVVTKDLAVLKQYLHPSAEIIVDMDPAPNTGQQQITYEQYMQVMQMGLQAIEKADVKTEILSLTINDEKTEAMVEQETTATMFVMGQTIKDVSRAKVKYGIINGQIKVLMSKNETVSSTKL